MKNFVIFSIVTTIALVSCENNTTKRDPKSKVNNIIVENEQFRLVVGNNATSQSLVFKATGEECLMPDEKVALFSVTQERPYNNEVKLGHPNKKTTFQADTIYWLCDNTLAVGFEIIPYKAVIEVKKNAHYVRFHLKDFIVNPNAYPDYMKFTPPPATEVRILQLPIRDRQYFGEWLNVSWDDKVAINVLATDEFAQIDSERRKGYRILRADAIKVIKMKEAGAALIVCETDNLLDNIARIEEDYDLPRGVESRRNSLINASYYWTANVHPGNVDQHIKYARMGGFQLMSIYYPSFEKSNGYRLIGNYEIDKDRFPNGKEDLAIMLKKIKAAGIVPGVHFLHTHIGRQSNYVTPVPDHRLNLTKNFNLSEDLSENDTEVYVEQNPEGSTMADGCRVLKIGTELISYENYTTTYPYKFIGCIRGIDQTIINSQPKGYLFGILDVSEYGATSIYINQQTSLQDEVAKRIADIYDAGFEFIYFDGSEGVNPPFAYNVPLAQYKVFQRLASQPIFAEGAAKAHFSWHMLSGGNAFDVFRPEELKEKTRKWPVEQAPRMRQDFTRINFGWLGYWVPNETTIGTQPDMLEYVTGVAAAWDCPISIQSNLHAFENHPRTADNLEVVRRWEEVRKQEWLTKAHKESLRNVDQEHHLLINTEGLFELVPYEQMHGAANTNKELRAFIFERKKKYWVVYWHISGEAKLKLPFNPSDVRLYKNPGQEETTVTALQDSIVIPVDNRRYLEISNMKKDDIVNAFKKGISMTVETSYKT